MFVLRVTGKSWVGFRLFFLHFSTNAKLHLYVSKNVHLYIFEAGVSTK